MKLSKKCLSATEEVKMWLDHLLQVAENRKRGVQKSKEKRKNSQQEYLYSILFCFNLFVSNYWFTFVQACPNINIEIQKKTLKNQKQTLNLQNIVLRNGHRNLLSNAKQKLDIILKYKFDLLVPVLTFSRGQSFITFHRVRLSFCWRFQIQFKSLTL